MNAIQMMHGLTANQLRFVVRAEDTLAFGTQPGSALRGALYSTLIDLFCDPNMPDALSATHPIHWLLAREDFAGERGENVPRPITAEPPKGRNQFERGDTLVFGLTLIGGARDMLPYIVRAVAEMGKRGIGKGRGCYTLLSIKERCPLLDTERRLMQDNTVQTPRLAVTPARVADSVDSLRPDQMTLRFYTPTRLIADGHLVKQFDMVTFIKRIVERCQSLVTYYAESEVAVQRDAWQTLYQTLTESAASVAILRDQTRWVEAYSGSKRQNRWTPISGFVGEVTIAGDLRPLQPWILWGAVLHVGKNAVKGNGWYDVIP